MATQSHLTDNRKQITDGAVVELVALSIPAVTAVQQLAVLAQPVCMMRMHFFFPVCSKGDPMR